MRKMTRYLFGLLLLAGVFVLPSQMDTTEADHAPQKAYEQQEQSVLGVQVIDLNETIDAGEALASR